MKLRSILSKKEESAGGGGMKEWGGGCGGGHRLSAAEQKEHICRMFLFPLDRITPSKANPTTRKECEL